MLVAQLIIGLEAFWLLVSLIYANEKWLCALWLAYDNDTKSQNTSNTECRIFSRFITFYHIWYHDCKTFAKEILPVEKSYRLRNLTVEFFWLIFTLFLIWSIRNQKISVILKNILIPKLIFDIIHPHGIIYDTPVKSYRLSFFGQFSHYFLFEAFWTRKYQWIWKISSIHN